MLTVDYNKLSFILSDTISVRKDSKENKATIESPYIIDYIKGSKSICNRALLLSAIFKKRIILELSYI